MLKLGFRQGKHTMRILIHVYVYTRYINPTPFFFYLYEVKRKAEFVLA